MNLTAGLRLRSQVCDTECIVVRAGRATDLRCGGHPMIPFGETPDDSLATDPRHAGGTQLGKRYVDADGLEILVTKAGVGTLSIGSVPLEIKAAKALPASD
jgi:hypothetical protein